MDGVHDMGGMHGFGRVVVEPDEPVFHARWEAVVRALESTVLNRFLNIDEFRHAQERMPPSRYLEASYYDRWLTAIETLLVEHGVLDAAALEQRRQAILADPAQPLPPDRPLDRPPAQTPTPPATCVPRFAVGDHVRARIMHPPGHTRLPRYVRGKSGVVRSVNGPFVLPDLNAHHLGQRWEPVYAVQFRAADLWGTGDHLVCVDLWESYLEHAA
jgi:nitrile hydratase